MKRIINLLMILFLFIYANCQTVVDKSYDLKNPYYNMIHASNVNVISRIGMNIFNFFGNSPKACINTVTYLFDKNNTCSSCKDFVKNPELWKFKEINKKEVSPGDIVIFINNKGIPYHAGIIVSLNPIKINHAVKNKMMFNCKLNNRITYKYYKYIN